eukprot:3257708-Lingulodinium_polyedra.AAC.1
MRLPQHHGRVRSHPWWRRPGARRWPAGPSVRQSAAVVAGKKGGPFERAVTNRSPADARGSAARQRQVAGGKPASQWQRERPQQGATG